jgi:hypothetical protein
VTIDVEALVFDDENEAKFACTPLRLTKFSRSSASGRVTTRIDPTAERAM